MQKKSDNPAGNAQDRAERKFKVREAVAGTWGVRRGEGMVKVQVKLHIAGIHEQEFRELSW